MGKAVVLKNINECAGNYLKQTQTLLKELELIPSEEKAKISGVKLEIERQKAQSELYLYFSALYTGHKGDYNQVMRRILAALPGFRKKLRYLDFNDFLRFDTMPVALPSDEHSPVFSLKRSVLKDKLVPSETTNLMMDFTIFAQLLMLYYCYDNLDACPALACENARYMMDLMELLKRWLNDNLRAKVLLACVLIFERGNAVSVLVSMRVSLMQQLTFSRGCNDFETAGVCIVVFLRSFIIERQYNQGYCFLRSVRFPAEASNNIAVRYYFYRGFILMFNGFYLHSYMAFNQAVRYCPINGGDVLKLRIAKYNVLNSLLCEQSRALNEVNIAELRRGKFGPQLTPYLVLAQVMRYQHPHRLKEVIELLRGFYEQDGVYHLLKRIPPMLTRRAVQSIIGSYKAISLEDVAQKLFLENAAEAEVVVANVIARSEITNAYIDREQNKLVCWDKTSAYGDYSGVIKLFQGVQHALKSMDNCVKSMIFDTKEYYEKMRHDAEEYIPAEKEFENSYTGGNRFNKRTDEGPDNGSV